MKPMLAHKLADHQSKLPEKVFIQPKLNGVRALYSGGRFQSRDEILWKPPVLQHLRDELIHLISDHMILDGELYVHGWSLQKINGAISVVRNEPSKHTSEVEYHVFDVIDTARPELSFRERFELLDALSHRILFQRALKIKTVTTHYCSQLHAEAHYALYRRSGYEGLMYRHPDKPYGFAHNCGNQQNRWPYLLKRKDWMDDDFPIVDFTTTTGDKGFRGFQLTCITPSGSTFDVGSGLSMLEVDDFTVTSPIGKTAKVKYEMLSDSGIPLKPTILAIL